MKPTKMNGVPRDTQDAQVMPGSNSGRSDLLGCLQEIASMGFIHMTLQQRDSGCQIHTSLCNLPLSASNDCSKSTNFEKSQTVVKGSLALVRHGEILLLQDDVVVGDEKSTRFRRW